MATSDIVELFNHLAEHVLNHVELFNHPIAFAET